MRLSLVPPRGLTGVVGGRDNRRSQGDHSAVSYVIAFEKYELDELALRNNLITHGSRSSSPHSTRSAVVLC
jgi:hypothetical protein